MQRNFHESDENNSNYLEKIFNLQLMVSKYEEELALYRNGTTAMELMDVIHEKDVELETLRTKFEEKEEKLRRLAKTSGEVLIKYEQLQEKLVKYEELQQMDEKKFDDILEESKVLQENQNELNTHVRSLKEEIQKKDDFIGQLQLQIWDLQQENHTKEIQYQQEMEKQTLRHRDELKYAQQLHDSLLKDTVSPLQEKEERLIAEIHHYKTCCEEQDQSIVNLQRRCANLVKEKNEKLNQLDHERQAMVDQVQAFRESMNYNLQQREESLRKKEEKIRELTFQVNILQQEIRLKNHRLAKGFGNDTEHMMPAVTSATVTNTAEEIMPLPIAPTAVAVMSSSPSGSATGGSSVSSSATTVNNNAPGSMMPIQQPIVTQKRTALTDKSDHLNTNTNNSSTTPNHGINKNTVVMKSAMKNTMTVAGVAVDQQKENQTMGCTSR